MKKFLVILIVVFLGCQTTQVKLTIEDLSDSVIIKDTTDDGKIESFGFLLLSKGILLPINNFTLGGDSWMQKADQVIFKTKSLQLSETQKTIYTAREKDPRIFLKKIDEESEQVFHKEKPQNIPIEKELKLFFMQKNNDLDLPLEPISIQFFTKEGEEDLQIAGFAGVNRYSGMGSFSHNQIQLKPIAVTKMFGPFMEAEDHFLNLLNQAEYWVYHKGKLFFYKDGFITLAFEE